MEEKKVSVADEIKRLAEEQRLARKKWLDAIKSALGADGKPVNDEDEEDYFGMSVWMGSGQYVVDRIKWNETHNDFKLRATLICPKDDSAPYWASADCLERGMLDEVLDKIVWE